MIPATKYIVQEEEMAITDISKNAMKVLEKRYLGKDENGNVMETVEDMFRRVSIPLPPWTPATTTASTRPDSAMIFLN